MFRLVYFLSVNCDYLWINFNYFDKNVYYIVDFVNF